MLTQDSNVGTKITLEMIVFSAQQQQCREVITEFRSKFSIYYSNSKINLLLE